MSILYVLSVTLTCLPWRLIQKLEGWIIHQISCSCKLHPIDGEPHLLFYALATSKVILGRVWTCDSAHSWWLYNTAPLGNQATSTMTTQAHYPDTRPTSPCPIIIMPSTWLGSDKYQFHKLFVWLDHGHWFDSNSQSLAREVRALPIRQRCLVVKSVAG